MIKILITSAGSLVGQNILDCLESRREHVCIIGLNSEPVNQRLFRCNKAYLVPPVADKEAFILAFEAIMKEEKPDVVLAGRDIDVVILAQYREQRDEIRSLIPCGPSWLAEIMFDKYLSSLFARDHHLPFADTFLFSGKSDKPELEKFVEKHGYPLVVKPREGFGSLGIFFVTDPEQLSHWIAKRRTILFQEYLGSPEKIINYRQYFSDGIPMFFQVHEEEHYAAQMFICPTGKIIRRMITRHKMFGGRAESLELLNNSAALRIADHYGRVCAEKGWRGFLNLQFKQDVKGRWKVYEMNPRIVGASSARLLMGYDELGMLMRYFYPDRRFPDLSLPRLRNGMVLKSLTDAYIEMRDIDQLIRNGYWIK